MKKYEVNYEGNWMQLILSRKIDDPESEYIVLNSVSEMDYYKNSANPYIHDHEEIRLYAESDEEDENKMYEELKEIIIEQAKENGIPIEKLQFYYDD